MQTFSNASNAGTTGTFVVPAGITSIQVEAVGGKGGNDPAHTDALSEPLPSRTGGYGAVVSADMPVVPGEVLYVYVGGNGEAASASGSPAEGGANGGGGSGSSVPAGGGAGGGGGASDVRTIAAPTSGSQTGSLESRLLVAGGGGGAATQPTKVLPVMATVGMPDRPARIATKGRPPSQGPQKHARRGRCRRNWSLVYPGAGRHAGRRWRSGQRHRLPRGWWWWWPTAAEAEPASTASRAPVGRAGWSRRPPLFPQRGSTRRVNPSSRSPTKRWRHHQPRPLSRPRRRRHPYRRQRLSSRSPAGSPLRRLGGTRRCTVWQTRPGVLLQPL